MNGSSISHFFRLVPTSIGIILGVVGALALKGLFFPEERGGDEGSRGVASQGQGGELAEMKAEVERLGRENRKLKGDLAAAKKPVGEAVTATPVAEVKEKEGLGEGMLKAMMEFGQQGATRKIDSEVAVLAERLNLTEAQQDEVRAALLAKLDKEKAAGLLMMKGQAKISDLAAADEDNFTEVDAAMAEILSDTQMEEYASYQHEREEKRVEKKANEDLEGLQDVADLSEEQADAAWDLFVNLNAADKPGEIPPDMTMADFEGWIDQAIEDRHTGLDGILTPDQQEAYRGQTAGFREMIVALIAGGVGEER